MRILAATGGAAHSDTAVRWGGFLAEATGSSLTLLTVIRHEDEQAQADAILTRAATLVPQLPQPPAHCVRQGRPATEIVHQAIEGQHDLVIVGERPSHGLVKRLLGPTAERVIADLPCPVLIARTEPIAVGRWLLCESGREPTLLERLTAGLEPMLELAESLTILHVMSQITAAPGVPGWELRADAEELMEKHTLEGNLLEHDVAALDQADIPIKAKVRHGLVVDEILAEADAGDYDLVVIGAHQGKGWERFLLDDLAKQIVAQVHRSILVA